MASSSIAAIPAGSPLGGVVSDIRDWLESENIEPVHFRAVVKATSLEFEISFADEHEAARFRRRFPSFEQVVA
jgi:hypothetical protein